MDAGTIPANPEPGDTAFTIKPSSTLVTTLVDPQTIPESPECPESRIDSFATLLPALDATDEFRLNTNLKEPICYSQPDGTWASWRLGDPSPLTEAGTAIFTPGREQGRPVVRIQPRVAGERISAAVRVRGTAPDRLEHDGDRSASAAGSDRRVLRSEAGLSVQRGGVDGQPDPGDGQEGRGARPPDLDRGVAPRPRDAGALPTVAPGTAAALLGILDVGSWVTARGVSGFSPTDCRRVRRTDEVVVGVAPPKPGDAWVESTTAAAIARPEVTAWARLELRSDASTYRFDLTIDVFEDDRQLATRH